MGGRFICVHLRHLRMVRLVSHDPEKSGSDPEKSGFELEKLSLDLEKLRLDLEKLSLDLGKATDAAGSEARDPRRGEWCGFSLDLATGEVRFAQAAAVPKSLE